MMVDEREGEVAAALSRLARRYFSLNISIWVFPVEYFHPNISIWVFLFQLPIFEK